MAVNGSTPTAWRPHAGQQTRFLSSGAFEALFGGQAGPGKTDCLLMEALRQVANPDYRAILFRRVYPMLEGADGLIDRSHKWFSQAPFKGKYNAHKHYWRFPSGSRIYFGHLQYEDTKRLYQGWQFQYIGFDELTEFTETQYLYLFTRCRTTVGSGLRCYVRGATNPGNIGHQWVKMRFITRDILNRARWFARVGEEDIEVESGEPFLHQGEEIIPRSRAFYPATRADNPSLDSVYVANLQAISDPVERAQLMEGDWDAEHSEGLMYPTWTRDNVTDEAEYREGQPVYWACDDGYVYGGGPGSENYHPRVITFWQDNDLGGMDLFDEVVATGENHTETIDRALAKGYPQAHLAYVDGSAAQFRGNLHDYGITTVNGTHKVSEGIKLVRTKINDGGVRRLRVHGRCTYSIYEVGQYRSDPNKKAQVGELVPMKVDDHCLDTWRYILYKRRHIMKAVA